MTLQELSTLIDRNPTPTLVYFLALPCLAWLLGLSQKSSPIQPSPLRWVYSIILFGVCLPGLLAVLVFTEKLARGQLMQIDLISQIVPVVSMIATWVLISRLPDPQSIPGFRRLTGFALILALTLLGGFLLMRTHVWLFFGSGIGSLLVFMGIFFLLLKWAFDRAFGRG